MKRMKVALLSAATVATIGGATVLGATVTNAQTTGDTLVERIASKFNLNQDEVQAVFDEVKNEKQAERKAEISEDLQDKVDSGDITAEQKTAIEAKMAEMETARETERTELEAWAEQNNIDMKYVFGGGRHGADLDDAVEDGDITAEQKTLIENKRDELEQKREDNRDALEQWAEDNGIDLKDVMPFGGHGRGGFGGGPMMGR